MLLIVLRLNLQTQTYFIIENKTCGAFRQTLSLHQLTDLKRRLVSWSDHGYKNAHRKASSKVHHPESTRVHKEAPDCGWLIHTSVLQGEIIILSSDKVMFNCIVVIITTGWGPILITTLVVSLPNVGIWKVIVWRVLWPSLDVLLVVDPNWQNVFRNNMSFCSTRQCCLLVYLLPTPLVAVNEIIASLCPTVI